MSSQFSFNFITSPQESETTTTTTTTTIIQDEYRCIINNRDDGQEEKIIAKNTQEKEKFNWIMSDISLFDKYMSKINEIQYDNDPASGLKRVRDIQFDVSEFKNSDLVSGVYEGGLKVWECSIDLCQYFRKHNTQLDGLVLELGCGHGLPGCFVLQQAWVKERNITARNYDNNVSVSSSSSSLSLSSSAHVTFIDYNDFVLYHATIPNIMLNTLLFCNETQHHHQQQQEDNANNNDDMKRTLSTWLANHVTLGAGDWMAMSRQLLLESSKQDKNQTMLTTNTLHQAPTNGQYDIILAAETTYSQQAAESTATLIVKHLKPGTGRAYISNKRYYFGVGGGSDAFRAALTKYKNINRQFNVQTLQIFDTGGGNVREILLVQSTK